MAGTSLDSAVAFTLFGKAKISFEEIQKVQLAHFIEHASPVLGLFLRREGYLA